MTVCFQSHPVFKKNNINFDQANEFFVSQGSVVTFLGVVDKCTITCIDYFFQDFVYQKLLKSVHFD